MVDLQFSTLLFLSISMAFPLILIFLLKNPNPNSAAKTYPVVGSILTIWKNKERRVQWISDMIISTPTLTFTLHRPLGYRQMFTANAANVQHILKNHFYNYPKGATFRTILSDFLGDGIFNADGDTWKFQRQLASHQFNTRSLRKFVETVVDSELSDRLVPTLAIAASSAAAVDLQDILQRFAFDNICRIAFGYDPAYLLPSLPEVEFAVVFDEALHLISERFNSNIPFLWKMKRALGVGKEKQLREKVGEIREFAKRITREKKEELRRKSSLESEDLLSRFLSSGNSDEDFVTDVVVCFILAGRDTTSAALTWFFWLLSSHPEVEEEILREIKQGRESDDGGSYDEVKSMVYTHAALCEAMRLYPPVPVSTKSASCDDVLPDGTVVKKGTRISYHPYAMGRVEKVWGPDWAEFRPLRWLEHAGGKWSFVGRDPYTYPVFQAGPRICLGKDMAFLQMKRVAAGILRRFRVLPAEESVAPVYVSDFTSKMKGGFMVRIQERGEP
ncbi:cytochrome P450 94A2-like [Salvia miltiorrhiza]|uniref:cytochrome P450 94A2-like n=1 Tax=Salvia miltiorrhiza TaxID=226208 RepID=UPI0025AB67E8|nr:cytochrome P450 94A2-like [Salvia miltiorrhiza]